MTKTISIHSFRGGTGKSNTSANVAAVLAKQMYGHYGQGRPRIKG